MLMNHSATYGDVATAGSSTINFKANIGSIFSLHLKKQTNKTKNKQKKDKAKVNQSKPKLMLTVGSYYAELKATPV